jgi:oxygen-independent coproporphyrinogen-3 oxidase
MKLLATSLRMVNLGRLIEAGVQGDYVYMYPPRQAYRTMPSDALDIVIRSSLIETVSEPVNLYLHFPFCRQICSFCNLYSVRTDGRDRFAEYVDLLAAEIQLWARLIQGRRVSTIYLGGGTPSLLPVAELDRCLRYLELAMGISRSDVSEVALEVAPDTVDATKLRDLSGIGISRVNLGLQTTSDDGLHQIGRRHGFLEARTAIEAALEAGFANVCVDLIYGLPQQTVSQWQSIVKDVLSLSVPTVCPYPLTLRPGTGFARREVSVDGSEQYAKYELARDLLVGAGYAQETHVRYVIPGHGGYQQKRNHWAGQDIVGIGAGARGYLHYCDYRNGYSIRRRRDALEAYRDRVRNGQLPFTEGILLNDDERRRRRMILGLLDLDLSAFNAEFGADARTVFPDQFRELERLDLIRYSGNRAQLSQRGRTYRDLIAQLFFSQEVWEQVSSFDYNE